MNRNGSSPSSSISGTRGHYNSSIENNSYKRSIFIPQTLKNTINKIDQELCENQELFDEDGETVNLNSEAARKLLLLECNRITTGTAPAANKHNRSATMLNINYSNGRNSPNHHHHHHHNGVGGSSSNLMNHHNSFHVSSSSSLPPPQQRNAHIVSSQSFNLNNNLGIDLFMLCFHLTKKKSIYIWCYIIDVKSINYSLIIIKFST